MLSFPEMMVEAANRVGDRKNEDSFFWCGSI